MMVPHHQGSILIFDTCLFLSISTQFLDLSQTQVICCNDDHDMIERLEARYYSFLHSTSDIFSVHAGQASLHRPRGFTKSC